MKRKIIVFLDSHNDVAPYRIFVEAASRLVDMNYDAVLLESSFPTFDEWVHRWGMLARARAAPDLLPKLSSLIRVTKRIKYVPIDAADRLLSREEIAAGFTSSLKDGLSAAESMQLLEFAEKLKADAPMREQAISTNFNKAFAENKGCLTFIGGAHVNTLYRGFVAQYPQHARNILFVSCDHTNNVAMLRAQGIAKKEISSILEGSQFQRLALARIPAEQCFMIDLSVPSSMDRILDSLIQYGKLEQDISLPSNQIAIGGEPQALPVYCCGVCSKPATKKCGACNQMPYCSVECQKGDWKRHKPSCKLLRSLKATGFAHGTGEP